MLSITDLDYAVQGRPLFRKASAQIAAGWKVGLIGRNGTGKSTLLRLIREEVENPTSDASITARALVGSPRKSKQRMIPLWMWSSRRIKNDMP